MKWRSAQPSDSETPKRVTLVHAEIEMSLPDEIESRVAIAFDQYLEALDAGRRDVLDTAAADRGRHDVRVYRTLRLTMSHIEAIDEHDEGTFVTWSVRAADGNPVARFSAIVSLDAEKLVVNRLVSREIDEQALASAAEVVVSAPINSLPRSSQYWVRRWEGRPSIPPSMIPPPTSGRSKQ
jgi:hypothetical protein